MITPRDLQSDILNRHPNTDTRKHMSEHEFQSLLNKLVTLLSPFPFPDIRTAFLNPDQGTFYVFPQVEIDLHRTTSRYVVLRSALQMTPNDPHFHHIHEYYTSGLKSYRVSLPTQHFSLAPLTPVAHNPLQRRDHCRAVRPNGNQQRHFGGRVLPSLPPGHRKHQQQTISTRRRVRLPPKGKVIAQTDFPGQNGRSAENAAGRGAGIRSDEADEAECAG